MDVGKRHAPTSHRPGMHGAELWCLQASWSRPQLRKPAFTVVVQDTDFFSQSSEYRAQNMPAFETFLVSTCVDGAVPQGSLLRWNTVSVEPWQSRYRWRFEPFDESHSVTEKQRVLSALMEPPWQDVLNLRALMPDPLNDVSRRRKRPQSGRSGSQWENVEDRISMNILPAGLPCFLAQCVARPKTFEALARDLWEYDDRFQRPSFRQRLWLGYLVGATDGTTPEKLSKKWWASCVAGVGRAIKRLKQIQAVQNEGNESCVLVPGISNELMNELLFTSHCQGHAGIYAQCMRQGHTPYILDLGGDSMTFFRGVEFSNLYMDDADHCYLHQKKRLILLQWWMQDTVTGHQICTGDVTLHYAKKMDLTKRWLLFEREILVKHSKTSLLTVRVWFGPYMGIYRKLFQIVQDQRKALKTAEQVSSLLFIRNMIESRVVKTVEEFIPAVVNCVNLGDLCILTGTLNSVTNHHVRLLKEMLPKNILKSEFA